jgi:hypothetical protein
VAKQHLERSIGDVLADPPQGGRAEESAAALVPGTPEGVNRDRHVNKGIAVSGGGVDMVDAVAKQRLER